MARYRSANFGFETVGRLKCDIGAASTLHGFDRPADVAGRLQAAMTLRVLDVAQAALLKRMLETETLPAWQRALRGRLSDLD